MQPTPERFGPARGFTIFAVIVWSIVAAASVAMALGNPTAINAVLGCSIPGVVVTYAAWSLHRQDRRHAEQMRDLRVRLDRE